MHDRKDQWILTIGALQLDKLRDIVKPHFESSMLYPLRGEFNIRVYTTLLYYNKPPYLNKISWL